MKLLLLGSSGLLGRRLTPFLSSKGFEVITHANTSSAKVRFDVTNKEKIIEALNIIKPQIIVNLVALTNVDFCEKNPLLAYQINSFPLKILSEFLQNNSSTYLLHLSTDQVYYGAGPHSESDYAPVNYYAYSKITSEMFLSKTNSISLRTNFFGKALTPERTSFSDFILNAIYSNNEISLVNDVFFSPLHLSTLAEVILKCIINQPTGVYNLGSHNGLSKMDFALELNKMLKGQLKYKSVSIVDLQLTAARPKDMRMNVSKIESELGIKLPTLLEEIERIRHDH